MRGIMDVGAGKDWLIWERSDTAGQLDGTAGAMILFRESRLRECWTRVVIYTVSAPNFKEI